MTRSRWTLALGAVFLTALSLASWLFVVGPRLQQAGEISAAVEDVRLQQAGLDEDIARLRALEADMPRKIEELQRLEDFFPTSAQQPELLDQIRTLAAEAGVTVQAIQPGIPELAEAGVPDPNAQQDPNGQENLSAEQQVAQAKAGEGVGVVGGSDQVASMQLSVTVQGSYENLRLFLTGVEGMPRSWLVDKLTVVAASTDQDLIMTVDGLLFVLDDSSLVVPAYSS